MDRTSHGGGCCGIRHLSGFGSINDSVRLSELKRNLVFTLNTDGSREFTKMGLREFTTLTGRKKGKVIEVVLTDGQIEDLPETAAYLKEFGFKLVNRFDNSTGSICNVLHYCASTLPEEGSPWANVVKSTTEQAAAPRLPQVGEVWRINRDTNRDRHNIPKNCYVRVTVCPDNPKGRYNVQCVNSKIRVKGGNFKLVELADISFIREQV